MSIDASQIDNNNILDKIYSVIMEHVHVFNNDLEIGGSFLELAGCINDCNNSNDNNDNSCNVIIRVLVCSMFYYYCALEIQ